VDAAHPDPDGQIVAVHAVLADIPGAIQMPELIVLNKADIADPEVVTRLRSRHPHSLVVSAHTGEGLSELLAAIADALPRPDVLIDVVVPYKRGDLVSRAHSKGEILQEEHTAVGTRLQVRVDAALAAELEASAVAGA
jgi:GTP-binding protein HflX